MIESMSEAFTEQAPSALVPEADMAQLSLMEQYGEQVVTFRGVTAPLNALVNLCPIPKDQMELEKIEEFASNILQESGFDISREQTALAVEAAKKKE